MSLNTMTIRGASLEEAIDLAVARDIPAIAPWRDIVASAGLAQAARRIRDAGLQVSSLCRGGMFTAPTREGRVKALDDNRRAVEEAAALGADALVLVCGPVVSGDPRASLSMIRDGIACTADFAEESGVRLAVEPLHPMMAASRSALCTVQQANAIIAEIGSPRVGLCVDVYHVWWDASALDEIDRAAGPLLGFHVSDWVTPIVGELASRGMMGDGVIDIRAWSAAMESAGYEGFIEVEVLSERWWARPASEVVDMSVMRFLEI